MDRVRALATTPAGVAAGSRPPWRFKRGLLWLHRWLSLCFAALWLVQACTGAMIVFHWEIDDATIAARRAATDPAALGREIARLAPAGSGRHVTAVWSSAGRPDRYDITVADEAGGAGAIVRVTGDGQPIRISKPHGPRRLIDTIVLLHQSMLAGQAGRWMIGASGALLLTNLAGGLAMAWPRRGGWLRTLRPSRRGPPAAQHYAWHRALGLIGALPALVLVGAGGLLAYGDGVAKLIGAAPVALPPRPGHAVVGFAQAVETAQRAIPASRLTAVSFPKAGDATYRVRLRAPGEWRRAYGASYVLVDAVTGQVRGVFPASAAPWPRRAYDTLFPVHTGEAGGLAGRVLALCTGLWLAAMIVIGVRLWWLRRPAQRRA